MRRLVPALLAGAAGGLLFGAAAGLEGRLGAGPLLSALLEEAGKVTLLLLFGGLGQGPARGLATRRETRSRGLALARGLSLGLVAVTVFAGAENLAYLLAFPEFGVLERLLWSLPVHLVAGLLEALGVLFLFRWLETKSGFRWRAAGLASCLGALGLAVCWHGAANLLAAEHPAAVPGGAVVAFLLFLVLLPQFLGRAYLGGFLHGTD